MPTVQRSKLLRAGGWRTLETFWNSKAEGVFLHPAGAEIKIRYGGGSIFGKDSQRQRLDGSHEKFLRVGGASILVARMQMRVAADAQVSYAIVLTGP